MQNVSLIKAPTTVHTNIEAFQCKTRQDVFKRHKHNIKMTHIQSYCTYGYLKNRGTLSQSAFTFWKDKYCKH